MEPVILASKSKNRRAVLESLGVPFQIISSNFNERSVKEDNPRLRAQKIALGKAQEVAKQHKRIIISADTFTVCEGRIMEKPKNLLQGKEMLAFLSGKKAISYTGFCFLNARTNSLFTNTTVTEVRFRKLSKVEIDRYVRKYPVTEWAAAYALIDLYLFSLVEYIRGSLTGLTHGLPTELLIPLLRKEGYRIIVDL